MVFPIHLVLCLSPVGHYRFHLPVPVHAPRSFSVSRQPILVSGPFPYRNTLLVAQARGTKRWDRCGTEPDTSPNTLASAPISSSSSPLSFSCPSLLSRSTNTPGLVDERLSPTYKRFLQPSGISLDQAPHRKCLSVSLPRLRDSGSGTDAHLCPGLIIEPCS